jgi:hypothetical protein
MMPVEALKSLRVEAEKQKRRLVWGEPPDLKKKIL